jgi:hypothetical protein
MDKLLLDTCALVRAPKKAGSTDPKVTVYGIAFQAPAAAQTVIRGCSTSPSFYFDAQGTGISKAFDAIANHINFLRLTQ